MESGSWQRDAFAKVWSFQKKSLLQSGKYVWLADSGKARGLSTKIVLSDSFLLWLKSAAMPKWLEMVHPVNK